MEIRFFGYPITIATIRCYVKDLHLPSKKSQSARSSKYLETLEKLEAVNQKIWAMKSEQRSLRKSAKINCSHNNKSELETIQ